MIWLRLVWRLLFQELIEVFHEAQEDVPPLFTEVQRAWELLENVILPMMDRRGVQLSIAELQGRAIMYISHLQNSMVGGVKVFSYAYITYTVHQLLHMPLSVSW